MAMLIASTAILTEVGAGRSESWAPHDIRSGQAHRRLYVVPTGPPSHFPRIHVTASFCIREKVEKFRPHPSHLGSALGPTEWPAAVTVARLWHTQRYRMSACTWTSNSTRSTLGWRGRNTIAAWP